MIIFYYTSCQKNKEKQFESLEEAIQNMKDHFWNCYSCAQMVVDFENKKIYILTDDMMESVLFERDNKLDFDYNLFEIKVIDD